MQQGRGRESKGYLPIFQVEGQNPFNFVQNVNVYS